MKHKRHIFCKILRKTINRSNSMSKKQGVLIALKMIPWWKKNPKKSIKKSSVNFFKKIANSDNKNLSD